MKVGSLLRNGLATILLALTMSCTRESEDKTSIFRLDGIDPAVYYTAQRAITDGYDGELAIIMIQGWHGGVQVLEEQLALQEAFDKAYVISPMFPRTEMTEKYNIENDGRAIWNESWPLDLTIPGSPDDDWRGGGDAYGTEFSSFDVIDILFERLSNKTLYPNLKRIALVGFSAGGQFVGRYLAVGKGEVRPDIELIYAAMAPSTYLMLDKNDSWHYGLKNRPRYSRAISDEQIMKNLRSRHCLHACGALDTLEESLDRTPTAMKQGNNRYLRFQNFKALVESDSCWNELTTFHTFESIGHSAVSAYADPFFVQYITGK